MNLSGWRDPYIIGRPGVDGHEGWSLIIGSGVKDSGGTVLVYTSDNLLDGWRVHGELCHGRENGAETGFVWECPLLCKLDELPRNAAHLLPGCPTTIKELAHERALIRPSAEHTTVLATVPPKPKPHFFCISPDACTNPSYYYLGDYDGATRRFDVANAEGPIRLDLGDILYAPNTLYDPAHDRTLLWGWNQEKRTKVDAYDYAGCLSLPRVLWLEPSASSSSSSGWALHQQPLPELSKLRNGSRCWRLHEELPPGFEEQGLIIDGGARLGVPVVTGPFLELELLLQPAAVVDGRETTATTASGLLLHSWASGPEGAAALLYHWETGVLEVIFEAIEPSTLTFSLTAPNARRVGGRLQRPPSPGEALSLRVFLDHSCIEVFTGSGEVLTARVYRGTGDSAGVELISVDGPTRVMHAAAYEMLPAFTAPDITEEEEAAAGAPLLLQELLASVAAAAEPSPTLSPVKAKTPRDDVADVLAAVEMLENAAVPTAAMA